MAKDLKILFIHCPKTNDYYEPLGDISFINIIPWGLFTMADFLDRNGVTAKILHMGLQRYRWGDPDPVRKLWEVKPEIAAYSLFWHHQSWDVINSAKKLRETFPALPILLGGLTASYFADEILRDYPFIDGIVTGDGEETILRIIQLNDEFKTEGGPPALNSGIFDRIPGELLMQIPNLKFLNLSGIHTSCCMNNTKNELLDSLREYRLDQLEDHQLYMDASTLPSFWVSGKGMAWMKNVFDRPVGVFFPLLGKGCPRKCTWCGKQVRSATIMRSPDKVVESVVKALESSYRSLCFAFDPNPSDSGYFETLFDEIRRAKDFSRIEVYFESWGFPGESFIKSFRETFPLGIIGISADTGDEAIRTRHRGPLHTDENLEKSLNLLDQYGVSFDLFFTLAVPGETRESFEKTVGLMNAAEKSHRMLDAVILQSIEIEPGSPWFENPDKFGIITDRRTFSDYVRIHGPGGAGSFNSLGYRIPGYFGNTQKNESIRSFEKRILDLRCRTRCFLKELLRTTALERENWANRNMSFWQGAPEPCYYRMLKTRYL